MPDFRRHVLHWYFTLRNAWPIWFYVLNRHGRQLLHRNPVSLSPLQHRMLDDMNRNGIAVTTLNDLFPGEHLLEHLQDFVRAHTADAQAYTKKEFLHAYWPTTPELDLENPFVALAIRQPILDIANRYLGMWTRLNYYHLATTQIVDGTATYSQRWHRDPEEVRMMKMFIYLTDVDEKSGPFIYVRESAVSSKGRYARLFPQYKPGGIYPPSDAITHAVEPADIMTATGKAGTVLFCDTTGLHRGGFATDNQRTMFTAFYTASTWSDPKRYTTPPTLDPHTLPASTQYALGLD